MRSRLTVGDLARDLDGWVTVTLLLSAANPMAGAKRTRNTNIQHKITKYRPLTLTRSVYSSPMQRLGEAIYSERREQRHGEYSVAIFSFR